MKRREFITLLGGAAAWPLAARAQQRERTRRIGVLMPLAADDSIAQTRNAAFIQGLQQLGWTVGQNVQIEYRWSGGSDEVTRKCASELAALAPEVILASGSAAAGPLLQVTRLVPIVFAIVPDPVGWPAALRWPPSRACLHSDAGGQKCAATRSVAQRPGRTTARPTVEQTLVLDIDTVARIVTSAAGKATTAVAGKATTAPKGAISVLDRSQSCEP